MTSSKGRNKLRKRQVNDGAFTPALGRADFTDSYDLAIRLATRERVWRAALLAQIALGDGETIVDVGCGTGTLAIMLKRAVPGARVIAFDPDPHVLAIAAAKAERECAEIEWRQGFARDAAALAGSVDKAVSSLVFHQVPIAEKRTGIAGMLAAVSRSGEVHVAYYARQKGWLMRWLFRLTVQRIDGLADTQPNADGVLESILAELGDGRVELTRVIPTATGAISLFKVVKAPGS
jgi:FkbM family methyltransferase